MSVFCVTLSCRRRKVGDSFGDTFLYTEMFGSSSGVICYIDVFSSLPIQVADMPFSEVARPCFAVGLSAYRLTLAACTYRPRHDFFSATFVSALRS